MRIREPRWPVAEYALDHHSPSLIGAVVALAVIQVVGTTFSAHNQPDRTSLDVLGYLLLAAGPALLLARRRYPVATLFGTIGVTLLYIGLGYPFGPVFLSVVVAFFGAIAFGHRAAAWVGAVIGFSGFVGAYRVSEGHWPGLGHYVGLAAWTLVVLVAAEVLRARRERAMEADRSRVEEMRRQASEERLRIARELHDVLAHNISLINVQAGVALHLIDEQPDQARSALTAIKQASKDALGELRSVLDVLRRGHEGAPRAPQAGLEQLDELVGRAAAAGLSVHVQTDGTNRPLPAGVDLAAYRIVQEALTNVTRHAASTTATVRVVYGNDDLVVEIDDDGRGASSDPNGSGTGIRGMRERAAALGGELEAGPRPGGGFRVRASLPLRG